MILFGETFTTSIRHTSNSSSVEPTVQISAQRWILDTLPIRANLKPSKDLQ